MSDNKTVMHIDPIQSYLLECRGLSVTAKFSVALHVFEQFCINKNVSGDLINEFLSYSWGFPDLKGLGNFDSWEKARTELVNFGLGDEASDQLRLILSQSKIEEFLFRKVIENLINILWGNFWGACDDEMTTEAFKTVLLSSKLEKYPLLTPFKFSKFKDESGWGEKNTEEDYLYWRRCFK